MEKEVVKIMKCSIELMLSSIDEYKPRQKGRMGFGVDL